jgi:hypothetical protein
MKVQEDSKSSDKELVTILNIDNYPELLQAPYQRIYYLPELSS